MPLTAEYHALGAIGARLINTASIFKPMGRELSIPPPPSLDEMRAYLAPNRSLLEEGRPWITNGLRANVRDGVEITEEEYFGVAEQVSQLAKTLEFALEVAIADRNWQEAVKWSVHLFDLSNGMHRGAMTDDIIATESHLFCGVKILSNSRRSIPPEIIATSLVKELLRIDGERDTWDVQLARRAAWEERVGLRSNPPDWDALISPFNFPTADEWHEYVVTITSHWNSPPEQRYAWTIQRKVQQRTLLRMLIVDLIVRLYRDMHGSYPESFAEFMPAPFRETALCDPCTGKDFHYRRTRDEFVLYSPGITQIDHGGQFGNLEDVFEGRADLCLDAWGYAQSCQTERAVP